jgi:CheY-like chemotaxis protein
MPKRLHVLVVDDQEVILEILARTIRRQGHDVTSAVNGQEALGKIEEKTPDLIVSDIKMPVMDGLELLKEVRQQHPKLPVILITGYVEQFTVEGAIEMGASAFITKPFKNVDIANTLNRLFPQYLYAQQAQTARRR